MKKFIVVLILILTNITYSQDYKSLWRKVEDLEIKGLPKSALKEVENIYQKAQRERNSQQIIKTLFYKSKFMLILEEKAQLKVINQFKKYASKSAFPEKNILENVLANLYWQYYRQHSWQFHDRTKTKEKVDKVDFRTWDLQTLFQEVHIHYQNSLKDKERLQNSNIYKYDEILKIDRKSRDLAPTLYDFLAQNALEFYKSSETDITKPNYEFKVNNPKLLADAKIFIGLNLTTKDNLSLQFNALKIYQDVMEFHLQKKKLKAFAYFDLQRLEFVKSRNDFPDNQAENLYIETLKKSEKKFQDDEVSGLYAYKIAKNYHYEANLLHKKHKTKNANALKICNAVIKKFPKSEGAKKCEALKKVILNKTLEIKTEQFTSIQQYSRALVTYKNIDNMYFSVYEITEKRIEELFRYSPKKTRISMINKLKKVTKWTTKLRNEHDYKVHSTEIIIPPLNNGRYLIVASVTPELSEESIYGFAQTQITDLVFIQVGNHKYQVVNRNTGRPIQGAKIHLKNKGKEKYNPKVNTTITTDKDGFAVLKGSNHHSDVVAIISTKNDKAVFGKFYIRDQYLGNDDNNEYDNEVRIKPYTFTDRSIYRPGQTVYFKTIFVAKQKDKTFPFTKGKVVMKVSDANGKEFKKMELQPNEYGSISGEFVLPNNGLTGEYEIEFEESDEDNKFYDNADYDFEYGTYHFSIEEYKRPKFEVDFKPVKETYSVNDKISVMGFAKAFSGAKITDAKVTYRVFRTARYPHWYYWYRPSPSSNAQEIKHGELTTDEKGNFTINFKALVDESVDKKSLPIFTYKVTAEVTDINGETHDTTTTINVGYHTLQATIDLPKEINKDEKNQLLTIDTKNLNGEFVSAKGTIKIFKLKAPNHPLRKRPWSAPDYQDISENEFRRLFPNEAYTKKEENERNWEKGALVFETKFNTEKSKEIKLPNFKKWNSGKYIAVLTSEDKLQQEVKDEIRFSLFSTKQNTISDNKLFFVQADKNEYKAGDKVQLQIGSASEDITVMLAIEKNHNIEETKIIHLNNQIKKISIPFTKADQREGGFAVKYYYVNYNNFDNGNIVFRASNQLGKLQIETKAFRDRLQPGAEQTWSFTIKNDKDDKVTAEILASMYDASLDEFKLHNWLFNPIRLKQYYVGYGGVSAYLSFKTEHFSVYNKKYPSLIGHRYLNTKWNWFGFSLDNQQWQQKSYVRELKQKRKQFIEDTKNERKDFDRITTGIVSDERGPLPGVNIMIKGTTYGTETDFDGKYSIKVKRGDVLVFSFLGMESVENKARKRVDVQMEVSNDSVLEEVVVTGYAKSASADTLQGGVSGVTMKRKGVSGSDKMIQVRGMNSLSSANKPLYVVDGVPMENMDTINTDDITSMNVLKGENATALYGAKGENGVVVITTKSGQAKLDKELSKVQTRENLQETAFFYPKLTTNKKGNVSFTFTMPEALTRWKLQLLAHNKELQSAVKTLETVTQKKIMVVPNAPRFLRQGDEITLSSKISNLSTKKLQGTAQLVLTNAVTGKSVDLLNSSVKNQSFSVDASGNTNVSWNLKIPDTIDVVQYKIVAKAGDFSDGEQNALPVVSNRMLVTETLPLWVNSNQTKTFTLEKLKNQHSSTLKNHKLTLEVTSNPAWYAVQALPYLMEYPYECAEQTFSRYYANTLAGYIVQQNPRIKQVFEQWKTSDALISNLEKNQELKSLIIQETPWLRDAESETEQKKRIALLFDLNQMKMMQENALNKLEDVQFSDGGFSWFKGAHRPNPYISQHIAIGFGHLKQLGVNTSDSQKMTRKLVSFLDDYITERYKNLLKESKEQKNPQKFLEEKHINNFELQYLYMRSFYPNQKLPRKTEKARVYYANQSAKYWQDFSLYGKGLIALIQFRNGNKPIANVILKSLDENSITSEELGMYWKKNIAGWGWYQAPIETQSLLIEAFSEIKNDTKTIDNLKKWLLKNKQVSRWKTTKATTEAVYALLLQGTDWVSVTNLVDVKLGDLEVNPTKNPEVQLEAGTGYFKTSWSADEIKPKMADVTITSKGKVSSWGGLYWQYFEDLDKITSAETPLKLKKKLFKKVNSDTGKELIEVNQTSDLKIGDLLTIRIELRSDRDMEFIFMKDMRASGVEPISVLSKYKWQDGLGYYESTKDVSTNFFFERLPKGVYVFEYDVRVNNAGNFSNGITTIENMYAPEFKSHSEGIRVKVKK